MLIAPLARLCQTQVWYRPERLLSQILNQSN